MTIISFRNTNHLHEHTYTHITSADIFFSYLYTIHVNHIFIFTWQFSSILQDDFHICYWYTTFFKHNFPQYLLNLNINHTLFMFRLHVNFKFHPLSIIWTIYHIIIITCQHLHAQIIQLFLLPWSMALSITSSFVNGQIFTEFLQWRKF